MARKRLETLTEQMYYVLLALWKEGRHGYAIMQEVKDLTRGRVAVGAGTLYALLARFQGEGLIALTDSKDGRKYYALTDRGRAVLSAEHERLRRLVEDGGYVMRGGGTE